MAYLNDNYLKLKAGYLFPEIARRVKTFCDANPDAAPHHWTNDIPRDDDGYLKLTKQQEDHLDRIVMGQPDTEKTR